MGKYEELRSTYPDFVFHGFTSDLQNGHLNIEYHFSIPGLCEFHPRWSIPFIGEKVTLNKTVLKMIFSLGMTELISYWKLTCSPKVTVLAGFLTEKEESFWKEQYFYGLGEFFHRNGIQPNREDFLKIVSLGQEFTGVDIPLTTGRGNLIPIGGGKDSAVTLELLRSLKEENLCYIINPRGATLDTVKAGGYSDEKVIIAHRTLDKNMLDLNQKGFLNGHTPFSAIVAFSGILAAYLNELCFVVLSNESSANESTVKGSTVNHQYSKSFKFEQDFNEYEKRFIKSGVNYFSMLRPLSEFQIAKYFAGLTSYHRIFKSCNAGSKENIWCGSCPKCLFVFLILSPFLDYDYLCNIFGTDLLQNPELYEVLEQLVGISEEKPFECVGSREEINAAICMTIKRFEVEKKPLPILLEQYKTTSTYEFYENLPDSLSTFYDSENLLPERFQKLLSRELGLILNPN